MDVHGSFVRPKVTHIKLCGRKAHMNENETREQIITRTSRLSGPRKSIDIYLPSSSEESFIPPSITTNMEAKRFGEPSNKTQNFNDSKKYSGIEQHKNSANGEKNSKSAPSESRPRHCRENTFPDIKCKFRSSIKRPREIIPTRTTMNSDDNKRTKDKYANMKTNNNNNNNNNTNLNHGHYALKGPSLRDLLAAIDGRAHGRSEIP